MADNQILIEINGVNFTEFLSGSIERNFDQFCGSFNFTTTKDLVQDYNISNGDYCNIYVNGKIALTGVIDSTNIDENTNSSNVELTGRDITCDIVDSELPESISLSGDFDLITVIQKVLKSLGLDKKIKVINEIKDLRKFTSADIISSEVDKNAFEFINEYAEKVSAILTTNEYGNIVVTRANNKVLKDKILNQIGNEENNVISSSASYDNSQRYYKYIVVSQSNMSTQSSSLSIENVSQKGIAYDNEIRQTRIKVIKSQNSCDSATCQEIATLEANVRRANSLDYSCTVAGYQLNDGSLYSVNKLMHVIDDDNYIDSNLLVKSVSFNFGEGSTTNLKFGYVDAYTLKSNLEEIESRANKTKNNKKKKKKGRKKKSSGLTDAQNKELNKMLGV